MGCFLDGKKEDDIERYVRDVVFNVVENKPLTQKDEEAIRAAVRLSVDLAISNHSAECAQTRGGSAKENFALVISIISAFAALGAVLVPFFLKS